MFDEQRIHHVFRHVADQALHEFHHAFVITIGFIRLEHGEFGIVLSRETLVAENAANLENLVHATDQHPFQWQFQRDAEIKIAAQRVVLRNERLRRRAAGNRLHHRCLDLNVAAFVQEIPDLADDFAAHQEQFLHLRVRHQIEITLPVADFRVFESMPLGGRRAQRLGEDDEAGDFYGNLIRLGREHRAVHADEIRKVQVRKNVPLLVAEDVFLRVDLHPPALVANVHEHAFAHVAVRGDAAGERDFAALGVVLARVLAGFPGRELVFERVNTPGPQRGELGLALFNQ